MIIHIDGPICSGKSTLAKSLAKNKNYFILDLDKIWDNEFLKYLKKNNIKSIAKEENDKVIEIADRKSKLMLNKYLEKNKKKHVILIGFGIDVSDIKGLVKYGLNIDFETSYRRCIKRTLNRFVKYEKHINKLIDKEQNINNIDFFLRHKLSIRVSQPHPPWVLKRSNDDKINFMISNGYKFFEYDDLYQEIITKYV